MTIKPMSTEASTHNSSCLIIAEAGVNHCGRLDIAKDLILAARDSGANAVKFQTWITEKLVLKDAKLAEYQRRNSPKSTNQFQMLKELELSQSDFRKLSAFSKRSGILFLSTPDEEDSADFLEKIDVPFFKIGSGELTNLPFLSYIAKKMSPIILSTGMSTLGEVEAAVREIEAAGNFQITLMHCVSEYPASPADCNISAMSTLKAAFGYPVGFSDHTMGASVAIAAVALGAKVIEKHLTLNSRMKGPDHKASFSPGQFQKFVEQIREVECALGSGRKCPTANELMTKKVVQKSIVTSRPIPAGKPIEMSDICLRRSSGGIPVSSLRFIVGRKTNRNLPGFVAINLCDIA